MTTRLTISGTPGEIYERHIVPGIFQQWAPALVETAGVQPGQRALDVACGTGVVTRVLAERVGSHGHVVGFDLNAGMLAAAHAATTNANVTWREGDVANMPFLDGSLHVVVCQQGLQFFPDKPAALREMRRVLAPGGRLALSVWRSIDNTPGFHVLEEKLALRIGNERAALPPFSLGDGQLLRALVTGAGFLEVRVEGDVKLTRFLTAEHFVRSVVGGAPSMLGDLAAQGPDVLDTIVSEVAAATRGYLDDEGWASPQATNIISAIA